jgi:hypothetical protein
MYYIIFAGRLICNTLLREIYRKLKVLTFNIQRTLPPWGGVLNYLDINWHRAMYLCQGCSPVRPTATHLARAWVKERKKNLFRNKFSAEEF